MAAKSGKTVWAGCILAALGVVHLASTFALSASYVPAWLSRGLWLDRVDVTALNPTAGAFWMSYGSFGVPLLLLGCVVVGMGRRGVAPPAYVGWGVGLWGLGGAYILEPTPFLLVLIPAGLIIAVARTYKAQPRQSTAAPAKLPTT